MRKATRTFLSHRPNAKLVSVALVDVEGTKANHCYQNSCLLADSNEKEMLVVSGWLVGEFFGDKGTSVVPHYWVYNEVTKQYFDPTPINPNDRQSYEYVVDWDIFRNGNEKSILPLPLRILGNGQLQARLLSGAFKDLESFDMAQLFSLRED
jgi:hypothetical protein